MSASTRSAALGVAQRANSPRCDALGDRVGEPVVHARVEARGRRAQLRMADGAQPQLDPQHPVLLERARRREALVDHRRQPLAPVAGRVALAPPMRESPARSNECSSAWASRASRVSKW